MNLRLFIPLVSALSLLAAHAVAAEDAVLRAKMEAEFQDQMRTRTSLKSAAANGACVIPAAMKQHPETEKVYASSLRIKMMMKMLPARMGNQTKAEVIDEMKVSISVAQAIAACTSAAKTGANVRG